MDITKFDVMILVVMSLAVVGMSFVMPALGLSSTSAEKSDIPELNVSNDRFAVSEDRPRFPNTATEGTLFLNTTKPTAFSENQIYLDSSSGSETTLTLIQNSTNGNAQITLTVFNSTDVVARDDITFDNSSQSGVLIAGEYEIAVEAADDHNPPDFLEVEWNIAEQAATDSWVGRIPGVGALFSTVDLVAQILAWAVTVFIWFSTSLVFGALNLVGIIVDVSVYFISLLSWLALTYGTVVSSAPAWGAVFVAIPGIILSATLGKIVIIMFRSLPTT